MSDVTRRAFIRQLLLGSAPAVPNAGERTLVCVFLRGGADTLNMVIPYGDDDYYKLRPNLGIAKPGSTTPGASLKLDDFYSFHPKLNPLLPIFKDGRLGIVQAVGSDNPTGSHFEAQDQMEHGDCYGHTAGGGWLGRHLHSRGGLQTPLSAVAIGPTIPESLRGAPNASALHSLEEVELKAPSGNTQAVAHTIGTMYGAEVGLLANAGKSAVDLLQRVESLRGKQYKPEGGAVYPDNSFGNGLREIARLIKAGVGLEVACVDLGGWDTHFVQGSVNGLQADSIKVLADGLAAFDADLKHDRDRVVTLVMTEFGRRIYENGSLGTDHGRGFAAIAIGTHVDGGKVHGDWPGLQEQTGDILGPAGLTIKYDYRSVLADVLVGFMGNKHIDKVFPRFHAQQVGLIKHARVLS